MNSFPETLSFNISCPMWLLNQQAKLYSEVQVVASSPLPRIANRVLSDVISTLFPLPSPSPERSPVDTTRLLLHLAALVSLSMAFTRLVLDLSDTVFKLIGDSSPFLAGGQQFRCRVAETHAWTAGFIVSSLIGV